jgi:hypothetical protein
LDYGEKAKRNEGYVISPAWRLEAILNVVAACSFAQGLLSSLFYFGPLWYFHFVRNLWSRNSKSDLIPCWAALIFDPYGNKPEPKIDPHKKTKPSVQAYPIA